MIAASLFVVRDALVKMVSDFVLYLQYRAGKVIVLTVNECRLLQYLDFGR